MSADRAEQRAERLQRAVGQLFQRLLLEANGVSGLSLSQEWIISLLMNAGDGMSSAELAREQGVTAQTMSNAVAALQRRDLIRGDPDPTDSRRTVLHATEDGIAALLRSRASKLRWLSETLAELPDSDLAALDDAVRVIGRVVNARGRST